VLACDEADWVGGVSLGTGAGVVRLGGGVAVRGWGMGKVVVVVVMVVYKSGMVIRSWSVGKVSGIVS
jgi:hypothetical protein